VTPDVVATGLTLDVIGVGLLFFYGPRSQTSHLGLRFCWRTTRLLVTAQS
jgi:hypothetical protein